MSRKKYETDEEKIAAVKNWLPYLIKHFPLTKRFYIRYMHEDDLHGDCATSRSGKSFIIRLSLKNNIANLYEWLIHEWAHAWIWDLHGDEEHPPEFYAAMGRIRTFMIDQDGVKHVLVPEDKVTNAEGVGHEEGSC